MNRTGCWQSITGDPLISMRASQFQGRVFGRVASLPVLSRGSPRHCQFPGCMRQAETQGCCAFHLHVTFLQKLKERLRQNYGSTAKAANYFQELLGDMVSFQDFCDLLRFLRIPFKDDEAKSFFTEVGKSRSNSLTTSYQTIVLREYLEAVSPPKTAEESKRESKHEIQREAPHRVLHAGNKRFVTTSEQSLGVDSSEFRTPKSPSVTSSPLASDLIQARDRNMLYFLRDSLDHLFSQGLPAVSLPEFTKTLEGFPQKFDVSEVKHLFAQAEDSSGTVTKESFKEFWGRAKDMSGVRASPFAAMLFRKLRSVYDTFLTAFEDITQGGNILLDFTQLDKLSATLSLEHSAYDLQSLLPSTAMSLHAFKTAWLNELHSVDLKCCLNKTCTEAVMFELSLCHKHKMYIQSQGSFVWTIVKSSLQPRKMVELISQLNTAKDESALSPSELRTVLHRFLPSLSLTPKDLGVLSEYLRLRLRKKERKNMRAESSPFFSPPQVSMEVKGGSFFNKGPWTPSAAGFSKTSVSRRGMRTADGKGAWFQFPYPQVTHMPLSP